MPERTVTIINTRGLHARSAAKLVALAKTFPCRIELQVQDKKADCNSMMALMMLAASLGTSVTVCTDEAENCIALDAVCALIDSGFEEDD